MEKALDVGIVTRGGGGDFPRNVMVSPLSGVEQGEYFDVLPYAEAASDYLMGFIKTVKMPRKLKVGFSNSPANETHATFRDPDLWRKRTVLLMYTVRAVLVTIRAWA